MHWLNGREDHAISLTYAKHKHASSKLLDVEATLQTDSEICAWLNVPLRGRSFKELQSLFLLFPSSHWLNPESLCLASHNTKSHHLGYVHAQFTPSTVSAARELTVPESSMFNSAHISSMKCCTL